MRGFVVTIERTANNRNTAFPVTDNFVRIGNLAYPITHSFVVGESWVDNPNAPAILECYNFVFMPPIVPIFTHFRTGGIFRASMKYSFSNYPIVSSGGWTEGPFIAQYLQETYGEEPIGTWGLDLVYYGIGYYGNGSGDGPGTILPAIPPVKTLITQSWRNPNVGTVYRPDPTTPDFVIIGDGWFSNDWWSTFQSSHLRGTLISLCGYTTGNGNLMESSAALTH